MIDMEIVAICGVTIVAAVISVMLKKYNPEFSVLISLCAGIFILFVILSKVMPAVQQIKNLLTATGMPSEYGMVLFKTLGICFLTQFAADSCRDAGEGSLASKVELAGKLMILIAALPLFEKIATIAVSLIGG